MQHVIATGAKDGTVSIWDSRKLQTPVAAAVHDCQVVRQKLHPSPTDILVDYIATPSELHKVERRASRPRGVIWDLLDPKQIEQTPPLQELRGIQGLAPAR